MKLRNYGVFPLLCGCLSLFLGNCGRGKPDETLIDPFLEELQTKNRVVLKVENITYYNSDFENYVRSIVGSAKADLNDESLSRLFDKFVEEKILLHVAQNRGVFLTSEEERDYLARLRSQFWREEKELDEFDIQLIFDKLVIEKYTYQLVQDIKVEAAEIEEYYNLHKRDFLQSERVQVSQILVKTEDKAIEILEKVKEVPEDEFRKIAQQESIGPEASKGGEMGWFELGQLPLEMESVIFSLKEGEVSPVVESAYGFHIFRLGKKYGMELVLLRKAATEIQIKLLDQKIRDAVSQHIEELRKTIRLEETPQNLSFQFQRKSS